MYRDQTLFVRLPIFVSDYVGLRSVEHEAVGLMPLLFNP